MNNILFFSVHLPEDFSSNWTWNRNILMGTGTRTGLFLRPPMSSGLLWRNYGDTTWICLFADIFAICRFPPSLNSEMKHWQDLVNTQLLWGSWKCWEIFSFECWLKRYLKQHDEASEISLHFIFHWCVLCCSVKTLQTNLHSTTKHAWP